MISGSARPDSTNRSLLHTIAEMLDDLPANFFDISTLPLFYDGRPADEVVDAWRAAVSSSTAVVISTPAYLHNMPASLKSALEWLAATGELAAKPVIAITLTPAPPRGDKAMQSLAWSLAALDARVVVTLDLYVADMSVDGSRLMIDHDSRVLIDAALRLL